MSTEIPQVSQVIGGIRDALAEFCDECTQWDRDFQLLIDELDNLDFSDRRIVAVPDADDSPLAALERRMASENGQLLERQDSISRDLADLRELVMEQTETFTGLLKEQMQVECRADEGAPRRQPLVRERDSVTADSEIIIKC